MAFANNVITAPVSIYDVQRCLGLSSNDVGTLCASERIKRWAKFKPVNIGGTYGGSTYINTYPLLNASTKRWDAATYDSRPLQDSVTCYLYEDGKKRATASDIKPQPIEPPTPTL